VIKKDFLVDEYQIKRKSVSDISKLLKCSQNTVTYWLQKYNIKKRNISDALYIKNNPRGNPFLFKTPKNSQQWFLYGLGLGLYWGEGNKKITTLSD